MDRLLRPKVFETETTDPNAEKLFKHWKITFENYIAATIPTPTPAADPNDAAAVATAETNTRTAARNKKFALINNISANIYDLIGDCDTYESAMDTLEAAYVRPTSTVFNRHQLITAKQEVGQSVDSYLQNLQQLAKNCKFEAVTADQYKKEYIRDAFINGISSSIIRQRLLEKIGDLSLDEAHTQARAMEQAQSQSASYETSAVAAIDSQDDNSLAATGQKQYIRTSNRSTPPKRQNHDNKNNNNKQELMWTPEN